MRRSIFAILVGLPLSISSDALAQTSAASDSAATFDALDTLWVVLAAVLVFFMQAGFGLVEAGLVRAKNAGNILMKNLMDFALASLAFFAVGYAVMWGAGNAFMGTEGWLLIGVASPAEGVPVYAFWFFQAAFVGAAATIVVRALVGRNYFSLLRISSAALLIGFATCQVIDLYEYLAQGVQVIRAKLTRRSGGRCGSASAHCTSVGSLGCRPIL